MKRHENPTDESTGITKLLVVSFFFFEIFLKASKRQQNTMFIWRRVTLYNQSTTRFGAAGSLLVSVQY